MDNEWKGPPKLILGVDIGTTYSGVTFLYLTEGVKPKEKIQRVMEWPGQRGREEAKVPTVVWYDRDRNAVKLGAEAYKLKASKAQADGLKVAKHFKHHIHPSTMAAKHKLDKPPLPYGVTPEQVYSDFMTYLFDNTRSFFGKKVLGGTAIWERLFPTMEVIIAHPNGWGAPEQGFLRKAARRAGVASSDSQIKFVTEAEASVHFCLSRPSLDLASKIEIGDKIVVCDAGGSTVDTTLYKITKKTPLELEEVKSSDCIQAGGIFVDGNTRSFLQAQFALVNNLSSGERLRYIEDGLEDFINNAKISFDNTEEDVIVKVGGLKDDFSKIEVDSGDMIIPSNSVAGFFDPCIEQITESLHEQIGGHYVPYMFLVGGFGDSPYLFTCLKSEFGSSLATLNDKTAKAVADGCVIWQLGQGVGEAGEAGASRVVSRRLRASYGTDAHRPFHPLLPGHMDRMKYMGQNGMLFVTGAWSEIVEQGTSMRLGEVKRETYRGLFRTNYPPITDYRTKIYSTDSASPFDFVMDDDGTVNPGFHEVCELSADLTALRGSLQRQVGLRGAYWVLKFTIGIRFGGTELEAFVEWEKNGQKRTGPVSVIAAERQ